MLASATPRIVRMAALAVSPFFLFLALYGAFAELEEVVVLYAEDADLRLWIVDHEGAQWVSMSREKAEAHHLDGARLELLRAGEKHCVVPRLFTDEVAKARTFELRNQKYFVQRLAAAIGMFGERVDAGNVTLRLDPCD